MRRINAQKARARLFQLGFIPLVRIRDTEHFVMGDWRLSLVYPGDKPGDVFATGGTALSYLARVKAR